MAQTSGRNRHGNSPRRQPNTPIGQNGGSANYNPNPQPNPGYYTQGQPNQGAQRQGLTPAQRRARQRRKQEILRRRRRHKRLLFAILLLLFIAVAFFLIRFFNGSANAPTDAGLDEVDAAADEDEEEKNYTGPATATIAFVGDISTSKDQVAAVTRGDGTYDFTTPFAEIEPYISSADYAVGDFETTMVDGVQYGGEPYYNSPIQLAGSLREIGFRLMSTANTYMLNNGIDGLTSTKKYLEEAKLKSVGTYTSQQERDTNGGAYIRTIHKIKFAFLAYTKGTDSVMMPKGCEYALNTLYTDYSDYWTTLRESQIRQDVQAAKAAGADVIVALVHWGSEYGRSISEPQKNAATLLMNSGVDVIIGTHSHLVGEMGFQKVTQSDGTSRECFVAYSLGDFYTDPTNTDSQASVILNLTFTKKDSGRVSIDASYVPIYQNITETDGKKSFQLMDVYKNLAELKGQEELSSTQATLYNQLLDVISTLHNYAGEDLDAGPSDTDQRLVEQAIETGAFSKRDIKALQEQEAEAAAKAQQEAQAGGASPSADAAAQDGETPTAEVSPAA